MFEDAFAGFKGKVQAVKQGIALFQGIDHAQALQVVLKPAVVRHADVQRILIGVAKRGVAQVVGQGNRLNQVFVQVQRSGDGPAQLRHFQRMGEPGAEQVTLVVQKHLGFVDQAAKRGRMDDAVPVALKVGAGRRRCFKEAAAPGFGRVTSVNG